VVYLGKEDFLIMEAQVLEVALSPKLEEAFASWVKTNEESTAEMKRSIAESDAKLERALAENDEKYKALVAESEARMDAALKRFIARAEKSIDRLADDVGGIGHRLGGLSELLVIPGVRKEMEAAGHRFSRAYANRKFKAVVRDFKQLIAEVDLFLSNGDEAMAVEVKTSLSVEDVNAHLDQLKKLRKYEKMTTLEGKKLYGAVVGVFIDDHARKLALKNGLYVLELLEDEKVLKTEKPPRCHVW